MFGPSKLVHDEKEDILERECVGEIVPEPPLIDVILAMLELRDRRPSTLEMSLGCWEGHEHRLVGRER